jgi:hypothetical protein
MADQRSGSHAHLRKLLVAGLAGISVLAACGGSDEVGGTVDGAAPQATQPAADAAAPSTTTTAPPTTSGDASSGVANGQPVASSGAENIVLVTIGDTTYEFDASPGTISDCNPDFFGAFFVNGASADGDSVSLLLPPPDDPNFEDPPSLRVKVNDGGADYTADPSILENGNYADVIDEGDSQVDSFTLDGNTASGTATFIDEQQIFAALGGTADDPEPIQGTFEVTCAAG